MSLTLWFPFRKEYFCFFPLGTKKFSMSAVCLFPLVAAVSLNKVSHTPVIRAERFVTLKTGAILHSVSLAVDHFTTISYMSSLLENINSVWSSYKYMIGKHGKCIDVLILHFCDENCRTGLS